jgi:hypothetical protein
LSSAPLATVSLGAALLLVAACGSGGADDGTPSASSSGATSASGGTSSGSTSSGGASSGGASGGAASGAVDCEAICSTYALLAFDVPGGVANLVNATFQVCRGTDCPQGKLTRLSTGDGYTLRFSPATVATIWMRPRQAGHARTSTSKVLRSSSDHRTRGEDA